MTDRSRWSKRQRQAEYQVRKKRTSERRKALIEKLGGKCALCEATEELCFDHPQRKTWQPRTVNQGQRQRMYERDAEDGNLRVLCWDCNSKYRPPGYGKAFGPKGAKVEIENGLPEKPADDIPF
jgi:hypothetical protein